MINLEFSVDRLLPSVNRNGCKLRGMSTITFDTLRFTEKLRSAGVSEAQAKAEAEALAVAFSEAMDSQIATKRDTDRLDGRLNLVQWMIGFNLAFTMAVLWKVFS